VLSDPRQAAKLFGNALLAAIVVELAVLTVRALMHWWW
jgi:hypothetical protein